MSGPVPIDLCGPAVRMADWLGVGNALGQEIATSAHGNAPSGIGIRTVIVRASEGEVSHGGDLVCRVGGDRWFCTDLQSLRSVLHRSDPPFRAGGFEGTPPPRAPLRRRPRDGPCLDCWFGGNHALSALRVRG